MNKFHDASGDDEPTPRGCEMEEPMDTQLVQAIRQETTIPSSQTHCDHQRLIDDVRTRNGKPTGKVRCLECRSIFDDPYRNVS